MQAAVAGSLQGPPLTLSLCQSNLHFASKPFALRRRCEVTGGAGAEHPVECHEHWVLDEASCTARLAGLMALAPDVHLAKHADRQKDERRRQAAMWTLQEVNE